MEARELRIGNLVRGETDHLKRPTIVDLNDMEFAHLFEGIPLTEEWLERFGFVKESKGGHEFWNNTDHDIFEYNGLYISLKDNEFYQFNVCEDDYYSNHCPMIQYIHQLQNLYHALTGEELKPK